MASNITKKIVKSDLAKDLGQEMKHLATNSIISATADAIQGKDPSENLQNNLNQAKKRISNQIQKNKKRKRAINPSKKKRHSNKIKKFNFIT